MSVIGESWSKQKHTVDIVWFGGSLSESLNVSEEKFLETVGVDFCSPTHLVWCRSHSGSGLILTWENGFCVTVTIFTLSVLKLASSVDSTIEQRSCSHLVLSKIVKEILTSWSGKVWGWILHCVHEKTNPSTIEMANPNAS